MNSLFKTQLFIVTLLLLVIGCKKEYPTLTEEKDYRKVDLTGVWNGYRYSGFGGQVPLETIKIEQSDTNQNYYIATKIMGDDAVLSGWRTWEGEVTGQTFNIILYLGSGTNSYAIDGMKMTVNNENLLSSTDFNMVFIRSTHKSL